MKNVILFLELVKKIYKRLKSIDRSLKNINRILENSNTNIDDVYRPVTPLISGSRKE